MELTNKVFNIVAPPFIFLLCIFGLPFQFLIRFFFSVLRSFFFTEDVKGKVVIITGAASGIGEQVAYEYARRGARLILADINGQGLPKVSSKCRQIGSPDTLTVTADVTNVNDCKRIVDSAIWHFKRLDHLVSNAGIASHSMLEDYIDITSPRSIMDVNFWGYVYITRFAIPHLRSTGGKIIVTASTASWMPVPTLSFYNASKAAIFSLFETLRIELGSDIHITIVTPGFVETGMTTKPTNIAEDGRMSDEFVRLFPLHKAEVCAKGIVKGACQGKRYVAEPAWYGVTFWLRAFFPELMDEMLRLLYLPKNKGSSIGLNVNLNPSSKSPEVKAE